MADNSSPTDPSPPPSAAMPPHADASAGFHDGIPPTGAPRPATRSRLLWVAIGVVMLALAFLVAWLIKFVAAERAMQQVAMAGAVLPMQPPTPAPPVTAPTTSGEPAYLTDDEEPGTAAKPPAASIVPPAEKLAAQSTAKPRPSPPRPAERPPRLARADNAPSKRSDETQRQRLEDRTGTFRRCPPLGKEGAVTCRWHICNGAAGKEAACRPYLERRP